MSGRGLMVALFAIETQQTQRATTDIDVLTDARARPSGTAWATGRLQALGATLQELQSSEPERGFRFDLDGLDRRCARPRRSGSIRCDDDRQAQDDPNPWWHAGAQPRRGRGDRGRRQGSHSPEADAHRGTAPQGPSASSPFTARGSAPRPRNAPGPLRRSACRAR